MKACIPKPVILVIDDVGWWSGSDDSEQNGPFRTGIPRRHSPADYQALVDLGRMTGVKPLLAMVLCEWDRYNILRELPSSTWMGSSWDNSANVTSQLDEAAAIINDNRDHIEFILHGIGHEFWDEFGKPTRAEWCCRETSTSRPKEEIIRHLEYYQKLMNQNGFGPLPEAFIPTAFSLVYGIENEDDVIPILARHGVKYINQPFDGGSNASFKRPPEHHLFGIDHGVPVVSRGVDSNPWFTLDGIPGMQADSVTIGTHWPAFLHEDPSRNGEVVERWAEYMLELDSRFDTMLVADSAEHARLVPYYALTKSTHTGDGFELDFSEYLQVMGQHHPDGFFMKIAGNESLTCPPQCKIEKTPKSHACSVFRIKPAVKVEKLFFRSR